MAWTDPTLTGYSDSATVLAELLYAINERETYVGLTASTWAHSGGTLAANPTPAQIAAADIQIQDMYYLDTETPGLISQMQDAIDTLMDGGSALLPYPYRWEFDAPAPEWTSGPLGTDYEDDSTWIAEIQEHLTAMSRVTWQLVLSQYSAEFAYSGGAASSAAAFAARDTYSKPAYSSDPTNYNALAYYSYGGVGAYYTRQSIYASNALMRTKIGSGSTIVSASVPFSTHRQTQYNAGTMDDFPVQAHEVTFSADFASASAQSLYQYALGDVLYDEMYEEIEGAQIDIDISGIIPSPFNSDFAFRFGGFDSTGQDVFNKASTGAPPNSWYSLALNPEPQDSALSTEIGWARFAVEPVFTYPGAEE